MSSEFFRALKDELVNDPLGRGYAGMTTEQKITSLNTANITQDVERLTGAQIYDAIDDAEFVTLTAAQKEVVDRVTSIEGSVSIVPTSRARTALANALTGKTNSLAALGALQTRQISRAQELGYGEIGVGFIFNAEALV